PETVKRFGLGYVPEGWQALVDAALAAGFNEAVLLQSGLAKRGDRGGVYDFFRNRLMVPIRDVSGQVVAFGGRDLGDSPAKYINSPENPVYKKSRVLYGLFEARDAMRREKRVILVEGYFDALRCFDSGIDHVVASCGTALTPEQAKLIHRYVSEVVLVYDGDPAGVKATLKGIGILTAEGLSVRALTLPDNQDPDDFVRAQGAEAFRRLVDDALDFVTFYVRANADKLASIEGRTEVARDVFVILADITEALRRDEYLKLLSRQLGMDEWLCRGEFSKFLRGQAAERPRRETPSEAAPEPVSPADRDFVAALISNDTLLDKAKAALADVSLEPGPLAEVLHLLMEGCGTELAHRIESGAAQRLYAAAVNVDRERFAEYAEAVVREQIVRIKKNALLAEEARIMQAIRQSDESKDPDRIKQLISAKSAIRRQIESVGAA
ncbi:MAG: primase, partial [Candidatus Hydrogenedentes bacterium]|nr:primase [Candidatus Hydrogenedentota bacterium]